MRGSKVLVITVPINYSVTQLVSTPQHTRLILLKASLYAHEEQQSDSDRITAKAFAVLNHSWLSAATIRCLQMHSSPPLFYINESVCNKNQRSS